MWASSDSSQPAKIGTSESLMFSKCSCADWQDPLLWRQDRG